VNKTWQLQEAKNKLSKLVEQALKDGAQVITRRGEKVVVVIPYQEYEQMTRPVKNLADFLAESPLAGSQMNIEREKSAPRDFEIEP
jgi:antitoxin Phd